eukprot:Gb_38579 [translate_table: standard]
MAIRMTTALVGIALYIALDPFHHSPIADFPNFKAHFVDYPYWSHLSLPTDPNNSLQKADINFLSEVSGPESLAFDPHNRGPYTGAADGRIMRWDGPNVGWTEFAYTSPNRSELCTKEEKSALAYVKNEHICGRPLGLRFNKHTGDLYIADAYFGLLVVGPQGGLATPLVSEAEGIPFRFTNDLDIDEDGNVYFTDSSSIYQRKNFIQLTFSGEDSGRVLKYSPHTNKTEVLLRGRQFPNGVALSKDGSFFVFAETSGVRLSRYWLKGPKAGTSETMAILPGFPDNVRANEKGEFWVAIHCRVNFVSYIFGRYPNVRMLLLRLPIPARLQYLMYIGGRLHAMVVKYSPQGELMEVLEDRTGKVVKAVSDVEERDGKLWMGSVLTNRIALYS